MGFNQRGATKEMAAAWVMGAGQRDIRADVAWWLLKAKKGWIWPSFGSMRMKLDASLPHLHATSMPRTRPMFSEFMLSFFHLICFQQWFNANQNHEGTCSFIHSFASCTVTHGQGKPMALLTWRQKAKCANFRAPLSGVTE